MKRIYLLGSLNCDLTIRAPYFPAAGETLKGSDFLITPGGKGANQAYACGALGGDVRMAGCAGGDSFGDMLLQSLTGAGVDCSAVRRTDVHTGVAVITVAGGENRIVLDEGANGCVAEGDAEALLDGARAGDIFMTQLEIPHPIVRFSLRLAKEKGMFTCLNPAPAVRGAAQFAPLCDLITPNRRELVLLTGEEGLEAGAEALLKMGAGRVLVTLGEKGAFYAEGARRAEFPAVSVGEAVDTTAAGDTFCGALSVKLAEGAEIGEAAAFAALAAGIAVTRRGAQVSIPNRAELMRYAK